VIAVAPECDELAFWADLEARRSDVDWLPLVARAEQGDLVDWAPSNLLPRLCSERLRQILDGVSDALVWLPVNVETPRGQLRYFILHFKEFADVIDPDKTIFAGGRILKPHLSASKVAQRRIFAIQPLSPSAIVDEGIMQALTEARCTGLEFERCPCS